MKRLFLMACSVVLVALVCCETAWAQTPAPPPGYRQETIQILVPDASAAVAAPTPDLPASPGQLPSATASAVGSGANAYASTDPNFYTPFSGNIQGGYGLPQGLVWQSCPQQQPYAQVRARDRWIHQRLTTTVYPEYAVPTSPPGPTVLPSNIRCRGNLFNRCPCDRCVSQRYRRGVGIGGGINGRIGLYH